MCIVYAESKFPQTYYTQFPSAGLGLLIGRIWILQTAAWTRHFYVGGFRHSVGGFGLAAVDFG